MSFKEIKLTLQYFWKSKNLSPDGWKYEFFVEFFDLVCEDLLRMVEESRKEGIFYESLSETFIDLILKSSNPNRLSVFRQVSLFNLVYKRIYKMIENGLKTYLSIRISREQFGFLHNRHILDAIETT